MEDDGSEVRDSSVFGSEVLAVVSSDVHSSVSVGEDVPSLSVGSIFLSELEDGSFRSVAKGWDLENESVVLSSDKVAGSVWFKVKDLILSIMGLVNGGLVLGLVFAVENEVTVGGISDFVGGIDAHGLD